MTQTQSLKIINIPSALNAKTVIEVIAKLNVFMKSSDIRVVIDFSETVFAAPSGLTPLLCYLRDIPRYKDKFRGLIVHSNNEQTDKLIEQMGFYNLLGISDNYEWDRDSTE